MPNPGFHRMPLKIDPASAGHCYIYRFYYLVVHFSSMETQCDCCTDSTFVALLASLSPQQPSDWDAELVSVAGDW